MGYTYIYVFDYAINHLCKWNKIINQFYSTNIEYGKKIANEYFCFKTEFNQSVKTIYNIKKLFIS